MPLHPEVSREPKPLGKTRASLDSLYGAPRAQANRVLVDTKSHVYAPHVALPHLTGAFTSPSSRGRAPSGAGWLVANVCVRLSAITIGAHTDTPHKRPPSRSHSAWTSLKNSW